VRAGPSPSSESPINFAPFPFLIPGTAVANVPADLLYTSDHEYVKSTDDPSIVQVGITDYAQDQLGDVVFVELPKKGAQYGAHDVFGTIEAVKAVSELFCPLAGEVVEVNARLDGEPALVNSDPYGAGWMIKLRVKGDKSGLLSADDYSKHIG
jgi:glycine cleavage system H protein